MAVNSAAIFGFIVAVFSYNVKAGGMSLWRRCLPGERWTEDCRSCYCDSEGFIECSAKKFPCDSDCYYPSSWYTETERCHCGSSRGGIICVELRYQEAMNNQSCPEVGALFYSDCMIATVLKAMLLNVKLLAVEILWVCVHQVNHRCSCARKCSCTHTMFHMCTPVTNCEEEKSGECPAVRVENLETYVWCKISMHHKCFMDGDCPGSQKCCLSHGCYNICTDPVPEADKELSALEE